MRHLKSVLAVLGAATLLVVAGNAIALAATGQSLLLGKSNSANNITAVTRTTSGSALKLTTTSSTVPPLLVNGKGKVTNLNADTVDGYDSTVLRDRSYVFLPKSFTDKQSVTYTLPLPSGTYLISYSTFLAGAASGGVECFVIEDNVGAPDAVTAYSAFVHTAGQGWDPALTGSGLVTKKSTTTIYVICDAASGSFSLPSPETTPFQIVATPTALVSKTALDPTSTSPKVEARRGQ